MLNTVTSYLSYSILLYKLKKTLLNAVTHICHTYNTTVRIPILLYKLDYTVYYSLKKWLRGRGERRKRNKSQIPIPIPIPSLIIVSTFRAATAKNAKVPWTSRICFHQGLPLNLRKSTRIENHKWIILRGLSKHTSKQMRHHTMYIIEKTSGFCS